MDLWQCRSSVRESECSLALVTQCSCLDNEQKLHGSGWIWIAAEHVGFDPASSATRYSLSSSRVDLVPRKADEMPNRGDSA